METRLSSPSREVVISGDVPFVIIGDRINPSGRKVLTEEMRHGVMDGVRADARAQADAGAHMLDVNAGVPESDEPALLVAAIRAVTEVTDLPLCIDSSRIEALEAGLAAYAGKALVNSVTAEEARLERILPLVRKHGAAVIGMTCDESGISMVPAQRLALARRIVERAADYGIPRHDVIIDPIATPIATNATSTSVTLQTIRLIRDDLGSNMTCGVSNVSFGLPDRATLNATFLSIAMHAGLTCAIANPLESEVRSAVLAKAAGRRSGANSGVS